MIARLQVKDALGERGWYLAALQRPPGQPD
jgi:hypothetical protein